MEDYRRPESIPACPACLSPNIGADSTAVWDREAKQWALLCTYDGIVCEDCGAESKGAEWIVPPVINE